MLLEAPCPVGPKGRPAAILALPPEDAWPSSDTLITRRQLADLYGVTVEVIRAWERRGKGPRKETNLKRGDFSPVLYRSGEARVWLEDVVAAQDAAVASCFSRSCIFGFRRRGNRACVRVKIKLRAAEKQKEN